MKKCKYTFYLVLALPACTGTPATTGGSGATEDSGHTSDDSGTSSSTAGHTSSTTGTSSGSESSSPSTQGTTTETESDTLTDTSTSDPDPFITVPDSYTEPECDTFTNDCPEGQKCMPYADDGGSSWNNLGCFDIMGDGMLEDPCSIVDSRTSGKDTCAAGFMCWDVDLETKEGYCTPFCQGTPENIYCEQEMYFCLAPSEGVLNLCLRECSPLLQDCAEGQGCFPVNNSYACAPVPDEQGLEGDPCEFINACQAGLACMLGEQVPNCESLACCTPFCDLNNPACENPETTCRPVYEEAPDWAAHIGFCGVMP